jgi:hypothetical protein
LEEKRKNFEKHLSSIQGRKSKQIELREKEEEALEDLRRREGILSRTLGGLISRRDVGYPHLSSLEWKQVLTNRRTSGMSRSEKPPSRKLPMRMISRDTTTLR